MTAQLPALGQSPGAPMRPPRLWPLLAGLGAASLGAWAWALGENRGAPDVLALALAALLLASWALARNTQDRLRSTRRRDPSCGPKLHNGSNRRGSASNRYKGIDNTKVQST
jgi:hypothetical protein